MCPTNLNCLTETTSADVDLEIDKYRTTRRKTNEFDDRLHRNPVDVKLNNDDSDRYGFKKVYYHGNSETFEHYADESHAKYEKSDKFEVKKTDECRQDFYRLSSRDDRLDSESADVREASSGLISGSDYHYYSYRKKCLKYMHFCVKSKRDFSIVYDNSDLSYDDNDNCDFDSVETSDFCDYNCHRSEASERSEDKFKVSSSTGESNVRVTKNLKTDFGTVNKMSTKTSENRCKHNGVYLKSQKFNSDESLSSCKTLRRSDNFEYTRKSQGNSSNTCYVKLTTIVEETLKMSKSCRSVKIRSQLAEPTSINGTEMAPVKKCAQILFRDSADDDDDDLTKRPAGCSGFLCNMDDDTLLHGCESTCNEINVKVEEVTWICKISVAVRRREELY